MDSRDKNGSDNLRGIKFAARALRSRNYRLFFAGQSISLIGTWMQALAMSWLVYRITGSALLLGLVGFTAQTPSLALGPIAGVIADRFDRRRILIATQSLSMMQAFALSALVLTDSIRVWHIIALSVFLGIVNSFDAPTRQAFVVELTERREDLSNAIALNSSMFNAARLVGPSIAGLLIAAVGEGMCFFLNGVSYIAVIISLTAMRMFAREVEPQVGAVLGRLKEGFVYAFGFPPIRAILLLLAVVSLTGMPYAILMPVFARDILHGGPGTLGLLMGCSGAGALAGAIFLASRRSVLGLGRLIPIAGTLFGVSLCVFAVSRILWLSAPLLVVAGFGMMAMMASSNTVLQTIVDENMRGRVMSFYTMSFLGVAPFGSLAAGALANEIGPSWTVALSGICTILAAAVFATKLRSLRAIVRPIYERMGILPRPANGVQAATQMTAPPESQAP